ncbi:phosphoribulokinase [Thiolapillus brandeum]|uniref:phosphoribulokinase n=1 Tax=Thiolapillus brandeum TaxID=1076588 RepID=A0A7U6GH40_9GAMM|nr:phosphoribulokinase [Thiolapillus brandeum]BAO43548.1 phosphoribulokinase [Thiolapillus brandeum]
MSSKHPIIAITGSSGAGTTTFRRIFDNIFRREGITAFRVDGNAFRRYDRKRMQHMVSQAEKQGRCLSHFAPEANFLDRLEGLFREYSRSGTGLCRRYVENETLADIYGVPVGSFTSWEEVPNGTDLLIYDGMHGGCAENSWTHREMSASHNPVIIRRRKKLKERKMRGIDIAQWVDLLIGVVPVINLEWIQKIYRDAHEKQKSPESTTHTIMRRMEDYIAYITPQFSLTDINFQRVPLTDTSNPFELREIPSLDESIVVIRFREPARYDFPSLLAQIPGARMTRRNTLMIPGGMLDIAIKSICTPLVHELVQRYRSAAAAPT